MLAVSLQLLKYSDKLCVNTFHPKTRINILLCLLWEIVVSVYNEDKVECKEGE